jgi:Fic family protein
MDNKSNDYVDGIVQLYIEATNGNCNPLTSETLFGWHKSLLKKSPYLDIGQYRNETHDPMQIVSGPLGREIIRFEAVPGRCVPEEMDRFLRWLDSPTEIDLPIKAGIAHIWFITIHPFIDGNGRMARALSDYILAENNSISPYYSLSKEILSNRKSYYNVLNETQTNTDLEITSWLAWFTKILIRAIENTLKNIDSIIEKSEYWSRIKQYSLNKNQYKILWRLQDNFIGLLTADKYAKITKCSLNTAVNELNHLISLNLIDNKFLKTPLSAIKFIP